MRSRSAFDEDEDEVTRHTDDDREVTLSSTTVLLIFFGLVLVCGLCFGLGYTLGHRSTPEGAIAAPITSQPTQIASTSGQPKPSAAAVTPAPVSDTSADSASNPDPATDESPAPAKPIAHETTPAPVPAREAAHDAAHDPAQAQAPAVVHPTIIQPQPKPAQTAANTPAIAPAALTTPVPAGIMVQIAAVSNANDAQVLVSALRKHGFSATVHSQTSDSLLHIQVGPFPTRTDAAQMKQKLLAEGYNAILK